MLSTDIILNLVAIITAIFAIATLFLFLGRSRTVELKAGQISFAARRDEGSEDKDNKAATSLAELLATSPAERQYQLLAQYHNQGLAQSRISFWFSLIFAALGFLVIVTSIFSLEPGVELTNQGRAFVSLVAGTIIDAVAALFFVQSNKARELMIAFFDKLRADRKLEEALKLGAEIAEPNAKDRLRTLMAIKFAEIDFSDGLITSLLGPLGVDAFPRGTNHQVIGSDNKSDAGTPIELPKLTPVPPVAATQTSAEIQS